MGSEVIFSNKKGTRRCLSSGAETLNPGLDSYDEDRMA